MENEKIKILENPEDLTEQPLSYEQLEELERVLFGPPEPHVEGAPLEWKTLKQDNFFVRNLKDMLGLFAHVIKKEVENKEKEIKAARKLYYGK